MVRTMMSMPMKKLSKFEGPAHTVEGKHDVAPAKPSLSVIVSDA